MDVYLWHIEHIHLATHVKHLLSLQYKLMLQWYFIAMLQCNFVINIKLRGRLSQVRWRRSAICSPYRTTQWSSPPDHKYHKYADDVQVYAALTASLSGRLSQTTRTLTTFSYTQPLPYHSVVVSVRPQVRWRRSAIQSPYRTTQWSFQPGNNLQ